MCMYICYNIYVCKYTYLHLFCANELKITLSGFGTYNCGSRAVVLHATNFVIIEFSSQLRETTTFMGESNHQHECLREKINLFCTPLIRVHLVALVGGGECKIKFNFYT
ncbi:unnamed protein product [Ceratitis capitata]|uniref:(Mediterranean fruit fly) hypothetical protein n=1 Tax=Ceratitis capitata TaxID=7213 RepID=A0A811V4N3_CERCA|nr:unnamed protein product [Ceratitis capitata]